MPTFQGQLLNGLVTFTTSVSGVTAYRTDLARGITAANVPYSGVLAEVTLAKPLSAAELSNGTAVNVLSARTVAES